MKVRIDSGQKCSLYIRVNAGNVAKCGMLKFIPGVLNWRVIPLQSIYATQLTCMLHVNWVEMGCCIAMQYPLHWAKMHWNAG